MAFFKLKVRKQDGEQKYVSYCKEIFILIFKTSSASKSNRIKILQFIVKM